MSESLAKILVHTVFSTKGRRPFLRDVVLADEMHRYLGGVLNELGCQSLLVVVWKTMCICSLPCLARELQRARSGS